MMKRFVYSVLAIFCFAVVSCTEEVPVPDYSKDHIVLNVFNSPMTRVAGDSDTDYERQLNRLDCFFYVKDKTNEPCVYYHKAEVNDLGSATIPFYVNDLVLKEIFPSGSLCDVFVIANLPENATFEAKTDTTTMQALGKYVLDMTAGEYDGIGKPFVMTGSARVQKGKNSNATAEIKLARVASKVTMKVKVPKSIEVQQGDNMVKMLPVLKDNENKVTLKTSFRYGTSKSYLSKAFPDDPNNYINTDKIPYRLSEETDSNYVFTCDVPFYTYARAWEKGADNAAYVTFEMPWVMDKNGDGKADDSYKTYYYQILVNGKGRNFVPNTYYDMTVTVGVLGSTVESIPKKLEELSYYVLDWTEETSGTGDRQENVQLDKYSYLEVPKTYIEMDNVSEVAIRYTASHKIGVKFREFTTDDEGVKVEGLSGTTKLSALYINNRSGTPTAVEIPVNTLKDAFEDDNKGLLTFKCDLSELQGALGLRYPIYSPVYVFITIWLDIDGDGVLYGDEESFKEDVKIVIYPAIYILGYKSEHFSVFVNGHYNNGNPNNLNNVNVHPYYSINGQQVGKAVGYDSDDPNQHMHVITVSSFNIDNYQFQLRGTDYPYIIGDPRSREPNTFGVSNGGNGWVSARDVDRDTRYLENYYPTEEEGSFQMIAPKFRISSKLAGYSHCSPQGAVYRCASYQEDGYPAGRWRLPTTAEVLFIVNLQQQEKIQDLFVGGSNYCSAMHTINTTKNNDGTYTLKIWDGIVLANDKTTVSVRCVYDEWYWGSKKEALENDTYPGGYQFTWGDKEIY